MIHLYQTGQDIHMTMAMQMTGKPAHLVTKEERKKAKSVNFGFLYGMQWKKYIQTAWENYGLRVTEKEAQAFRHAFFQQFPALLVWHRRQRAQVATYGSVERSEEHTSELASLIRSSYPDFCCKQRTSDD